VIKTKNVEEEMVRTLTNVRALQTDLPKQLDEKIKQSINEAR
jgi:hypothetical protein